MTNIKQISQLSEAGGSLNEDTVFVNRQLGIFGVFDGASSLNKYSTSDGKTGGYVASHMAAEAFESPNEDLSILALQANRNIENSYKKTEIKVSSPIDRFGTTAAVIKIQNDKADLLQVADSVILIIYTDGRVEVPLGYHDHDLPIMQTWRKLANEGATNIRNVIADDIVELRNSANVTYGVINGDKKVEDFIKTTTIGLLNVATIILLTDGMYLPKENPEQDENWGEYARLYKEGGLRKIYNTVRSLELSDPNLIMYPRYKLHDDASAIAVDLVE